MNLRLLLPFNKYICIILEKREIKRQTGCMKMQENNITSIKYVKLTIG